MENSENLKKLERVTRIKRALDQDLKPLILSPLLIAIFLRFIPELIKNAISTDGKADLSSQIPIIQHRNTWQTEKHFILYIFAVTALGILAYYLVLWAGTKDVEKDRNPSTTLETSDNKLKIFFDTLFGRHQVFKNSHRNWPELQAAFSLISLILISTLLIQVCWTFLYIFTDFDQPFSYFLFSSIRKYGSNAELAIKAPVGFISLYFGIFVYIKKDYAEKWRYCADAYNKLVAGNPNIKLSTRAALAIDVLYLDLWAKRGFCKFFHTTLEEIIYLRSDWSDDKKANTARDLKEHRLKSIEAEEILEYGLHLK